VPTRAPDPNGRSAARFSRGTAYAPGCQDRAGPPRKTRVNCQLGSVGGRIGGAPSGTAHALVRRNGAPDLKKPRARTVHLHVAYNAPNGVKNLPALRGNTDSARALPATTAEPQGCAAVRRGVGVRSECQKMRGRITSPCRCLAAVPGARLEEQPAGVPL
jgi:hypothetical protein